MAEPQPPTVSEGMDDPPPPPAAAEDRKAAAAMNALESSRKEENEEDQKPTKQVDLAALNKAISRLDFATDAGRSAAQDPNEERRKRREEEKREKERRAKIKVDQADVSLLVEECDLSKIKATELLRAHEGDFEKALRSFLRAWT